MAESAVAYVLICKRGEHSPKAKGCLRRNFNIEYMEQRRRIVQFARRNRFCVDTPSAKSRKKHRLTSLQDRGFKNCLAS